MTDKSSPKDDPEAEARFKQTLQNMLASPHKPHKSKDGREPKPAPGSITGR
jgi:hypothetical protein